MNATAGGVTQEVHFVKQISFSLAVGLASLLIGCAQPGKHQAPVEDRTLTSQQAAVLSQLLRDADEWETQRQAALVETDRIAWATVRKQKITDHAKCRIIPPALKESVFFPRFQKLMTDQYGGKCMVAVDDYRKAAAAAKTKAKK